MCRQVAQVRATHQWGLKCQKTCKLQLHCATKLLPTAQHSKFQRETLWKIPVNLEICWKNFRNSSLYYYSHLLFTFIKQVWDIYLKNKEFISFHLIWSFIYFLYLGTSWKTVTQFVKPKETFLFFVFTYFIHIIHI